MDGSSPTGNPVTDIVVVVILILIGGFFAASEIALITAKRYRLGQLADDGNRSARTAQRLVEDPSRFLATIQIAITFLGFLAGAVGAAAFSRYLAELIDDIPWTLVQDAAGGIAFVIVTLVIALTSIIVGELVPKTLALNFPERFAVVVARPIGFLQTLLSPIVWFVTRISTVLVRLLGGREKPQGGYLSTEELKILVETGSEQGEIEEEEKEMIHGVIELGDEVVHEVMVPRIGIRAVNVNDPLDEVIDTIVRAGHSRLPVFDESLDNIIGILYAKDLLPYLKGNGRSNGDIDLRSLVRPGRLRPRVEAGGRPPATFLAAAGLLLGAGSLDRERHLRRDHAGELQIVVAGRRRRGVEQHQHADDAVEADEWNRRQRGDAFARQGRQVGLRASGPSSRPIPTSAEGLDYLVARAWPSTARRYDSERPRNALKRRTPSGSNRRIEARSTPSPEFSASSAAP